jgi:hypothetical protein
MHRMATMVGPARELGSPPRQRQRPAMTAARLLEEPTHTEEAALREINITGSARWR